MRQFQGQVSENIIFWNSISKVNFIFKVKYDFSINGIKTRRAGVQKFYSKEKSQSARPHELIQEKPQHP